MKSKGGSKVFDGLMDRYFEKYLEEHPSLGAVAGLDESRGKLESSEQVFADRWHRRKRSILAELDGISPRELSAEQHLDRLALRSQLLRETEDYEWGKQELEPSAVDGLLHLVLHELLQEDGAKGARNIRSLLWRIPDYLDGASRWVRRPEKVWRDIMDETVQGVPGFLGALKSYLQQYPDGGGDEASLKSVERACARYQARVHDQPLAPKGSFAIGRVRLARRVRDQLGIDYTLGEVEALALSEVSRVGGLLTKECAKFGRNRKVEDIIQEGRVQWDPGDQLVELYEKTTEAIAGGFRRARAVTFPKGDTLRVKPVPAFMRHLFPTAAYNPPGPFAKRQIGTFWVNDLSVTRKTEAERRKERQQHFGLSLTCAHEAYPGHHLQFVMANRHPRRWRALFAHAIFYEGWTLWCEQMMVDLQIDTNPWLRVQQLHDALWRCHRILVDLRLQTGVYSYEKAVRHLQKHLGWTAARAGADVNWYTSSPSVPMSYWMGRLENERLQRRLMGGRGWSLCHFNDWLLSFGTLPQGWIEKYGLD